MSNLSENGCTVNDRALLKQIGGTIELGNKWWETKQMGIVKYKAKTAKPIITPGLISEIGHTSDHSINKIVNAHEIPTEMVINIEQKILPFTLISKFFYFLFGCPTANLGHSQGDSLNNLMLITAF